MRAFGDKVPISADVGVLSVNLRLDPNETIQMMSSVLDELIKLGWTPSEISLLGYGQGGTLAGEFALAYPQSRQEEDEKEKGEWKGANERPCIRSVISIQGPLLSFPTTGTSASQRPVHALLAYALHCSDKKDDDRTPTTACLQDVAAWKRAFALAVDLNFKHCGEGSGAKGRMPSSRDEWQGIMVFWDKVLHRWDSLAEAEGMYRVM